MYFQIAISIVVCDPCIVLCSFNVMGNFDCFCHFFTVRDMSYWASNYYNQWTINVNEMCSYCIQRQMFS